MDNIGNFAYISLMWIGLHFYLDYDVYCDEKHLFFKVKNLRGEKLAPQSMV